MRWTVSLVIASLVAVGAHGLGAKQDPEREEPERVRVQHVLIAFRGSVRNKLVDRTKKEAEVLAGEVLRRARQGEDFDALVRAYSADGSPGVYRISNRKVEPLPGEHRRYSLAKRFGDVAFGLDVGEIGLAEYHPTRCPFGWHIIRRLE